VTTIVETPLLGLDEPVVETTTGFAAGA